MASFSKLQKRERIMVASLGVVAVLAILFKLLTGGGEDPSAGGTTFRPTTRRTTPGATAQPTVVPSAIDNFQGKDPFKPLISPSGSGTGSGSPQPTSTASPGATGGTQTGSRVALLDIYTQDGVRFASVQIGEDIHNVKAGDTFAGSYRVVTITDQCATFVKGDERFTLCIGQEVFK